MKQIILIFITISTLNFSATAQNKTNTPVTKEIVKQEVTKLVQLMETKLPKTTIGEEPERSLSASEYKTLVLVYHKNGTRDLWMEEFCDVGANGLGEPCSKYVSGSECDGYPNNSSQSAAPFASWS